MSDVLYESSDHVATITLDRPDKRNAITVAMFGEIGDALRRAEGEKARCIVLTGSGGAFSAGLDFGDAMANMDALDSEAFEFDRTRSPAIILQDLDVPVIAAINGAAAGYAVGMAINADIRVMARDARFVPATKRNLLPESGDTWLLPRLAGWEQAARFYFLGEDMTGEQALAAGIVSEVADDSDATKRRAGELASQIAAMPPLAVQAAKRVMRAGLTESYPAHVERTLLQLLPLFRTKDFNEAMAAFFEKRDPEFTGE